MHGDDEAGRAIREFIAAYEDALLVYTHLKTRYSGARFDEEALKRPAPDSMRADAVAALKSQQRVVSAVKRLCSLATEAGFAPSGVPDEAKTTELSELQWFALGMRLGRDWAARAGRGQTLDVRALRSGKWT